MIPRSSFFRSFYFTSHRHSSGPLIQVSRSRFLATLTSKTQQDFDVQTDVLIVGSGGAGLTAALRAQSLGLKTLLIEKGAKIGGTTAYSGGALWIPDNHVSRAAGAQDSTELALKYFDARLGEPSPASSLQRRQAFLDSGPKMVKFLAEQGFEWVPSKGYPDYYPELAGALVGARTIEGARFNSNKLGDSRELVLSRSGPPVPPLHIFEGNMVTKMMSSWRYFLSTTWLMAKITAPRLTGAKLVSSGQSLVGQLLLLNKQKGTQIWRDSPILSLVKDSDGTVVGAKVQNNGSSKIIRARHGVLLCSGGFARNKELREKWGPAPASVEWTSVPPGDMGDGIKLGIEAGAATALLDDAWWGPTISNPVGGAPWFAVLDRSRPFSIIVDSSGSRFMNEAQAYSDAGHEQYKRHQKSPAIPAWLILDSNHRKRYFLGTLMARQDTKKAVTAGHLFKAETIQDLAKQIGVDAEGLLETVARFNRFCRSGIDEDFGRGKSAYDRWFGDPAVVPNPSLGLIGKPPFYATRVWPGDLGTKGGLLTDEAARVLKDDGSTIPGLYAAGNVSASVMGEAYLGAGATLGPALTFAYISVNHMAGRKVFR